MVVYPNAKINIGLHITRKRTDGFHQIESCFAPIALYDILEIVESDNDPTFCSSGMLIPGSEDDNICLKAWRIMHQHYQIPPVNMHLHKQIPIGAGLGGGSADAAFALKAFSSLFKLNLSNKQLTGLAAQLGSDCAFFIGNTTSMATGRGEILEEYPLSLSKYMLVLINPAIHIGTAEAYAGIEPKIPEVSLHHLLKKPISKWKNMIKNDFEKSIFQKYPLIKEVKNQLYNHGAVYASMSGSGSTVYGLFKNPVPVEIEKNFAGMFCFSCPIIE